MHGATKRNHKHPHKGENTKGVKGREFKKGGQGGRGKSVRKSGLSVRSPNGFGDAEKKKNREGERPQVNRTLTMKGFLTLKRWEFRRRTLTPERGIPCGENLFTRKLEKAQFKGQGRPQHCGL